MKTTEAAASNNEQAAFNAVAAILRKLAEDIESGAANVASFSLTAPLFGLTRIECDYTPRSIMSDIGNAYGITQSHVDAVLDDLLKD